MGFHGPHRSRLATRAGVLSLLLLFFAQPAAGQEDSGGKRKWLFALAGAVLIGVPAALADEQEDTFCGSKECMVGAGAAAGATVGFLIGRELDSRAGRESDLGPRLRVATRPVQLELTPESVTAFDGGAVVVGREGLAVVGPGEGVTSLGGEMRGLRTAEAFPGHGALLASTAGGLFAFPLTGTAIQGRQVESEGAALLEAIGADDVLVARGGIWRRLRLGGQGSGVTLSEDARQEVGAAAAAEHSSSSGVIWSLSGTRLVARSAGQLSEVGAVALPAAGRTLSLDDGRVLVSAGAEGLVLVDVATPEEPRLLARMGGLGFVHDAALVGETAYVAAGPRGLLLVDISDPAQPRVSGVARDLGFVADLARDGSGPLYALDREGRTLHVVELRAPTPGSQ